MIFYDNNDLEPEHLEPQPAQQSVIAFEFNTTWGELFKLQKRLLEDRQLRWEATEIWDRVD